MNSKFFYYSIAFASIFLIFINTVAPTSTWVKAIFFFIIFCTIISIFYIFSLKHMLNFLCSIYLVALFLLFFFRQFNPLNFIVLTGILVTTLFLLKKNPDNSKS